MTRRRWQCVAANLMMVLVVAAMPGCGWRGVNSLPLPGTQGTGSGSFLIQAQLPDVNNIEPNSRVRVADVTVGHVTKIERQGWHALLSMRLNGDVNLPANATAKIGTTSLLGSLAHRACAADKRTATRKAAATARSFRCRKAVPTRAPSRPWRRCRWCSTAADWARCRTSPRRSPPRFGAASKTVRSLITQLDEFTTHLNGQTDDIIAATDSLNRLVGKFAAQQPVLDRALATVPDALAVLNSERDNLVEAADQLGKFSALTVDTVNQTKDNLVKELTQVGPVLESLANAGPSLTRSLSLLATFPFPNETFENFQRGDYANLTAIVDLTLSRIDQGIFTGTRFECELTELELQWGRTIGQFPSPCMSGGPNGPGNPLAIPYRWDQGP